MGFWDDIKKSYNEGLQKGRQLGSFDYQKGQSLEKVEKKQREKDRLKELQQQGIPFCPKCHSTHLQYIEHRKRLSIGRAVVGGALAGGVGAAIGGLTSKKYKGKLKCLNCGHEWKL